MNAHRSETRAARLLGVGALVVAECCQAMLMFGTYFAVLREPALQWAMASAGWPIYVMPVGYVACIRGSRWGLRLAAICTVGLAVAVLVTAVVRGWHPLGDVRPPSIEDAAWSLLLGGVPAGLLAIGILVMSSVFHDVDAIPSPAAGVPSEDAEGWKGLAAPAAGVGEAGRPAARRVRDWVLGLVVLAAFLVLVVGVGGFLVPGIGSAPDGGIFRPTGPMTAAREYHTSTLLPDGRILLAGGSIPQIGVNPDEPALVSAELFQPADGTFSPTGSMATARTGHTATLLTDGRVLVTGGRHAGGLDDSTGLSSAEFYDARVGAFSPTGKMTASRTGHTATLLPDGRVLVAGGSASLHAEIFDTRDGTFSETGAMVARRAGHTATLLADGRVLLIGGTSERVASAEVFDPGTGRFSSTGSLPGIRVGHTATLLPDGRVLVVGWSEYGYNPDRSARDPMLYDPPTGTFAATGHLVTARHVHAAAALADGCVLIVGGMAPDTSSTTERAWDGEVFDPRTSTFRRTGSMEAPLWGHAATLLADGRVLVAGGYNASASAFLYEPAQQER
jgi:hypothetical protein